MFSRVISFMNHVHILTCGFTVTLILEQTLYIFILICQRPISGTVKCGSSPLISAEEPITNGRRVLKLGPFIKRNHQSTIPLDVNSQTCLKSCNYLLKLCRKPLSTYILLNSDLFPTLNLCSNEIYRFGIPSWSVSGWHSSTILLQLLKWNERVKIKWRVGWTFVMEMLRKTAYKISAKYAEYVLCRFWLVLRAAY